MVITESQIRRTMPNARGENVKAFVDAFNRWCDVFEIDTKQRMAAFLANVAEETGQLTRFEENMNYSAARLMQVWPKRFDAAKAQAYGGKPTKIASYVYANRMGNGDEASGDGWRFRGRGCLQLTGRAQYQAYAKSEYCNGNLMANPEWLGRFPGALKSAMWYWKTNNLNRFADEEDIDGLCRAINGGTNGLANRKYFWRLAKKALFI